MTTANKGLLPAGITRADLAQSTFQALLKGIPVFGEALNQFLSGPLEAARWHRP